MKRPGGLFALRVRYRLGAAPVCVQVSAASGRRKASAYPAAGLHAALSQPVRHHKYSCHECDGRSGIRREGVVEQPAERATLSGKKALVLGAGTPAGGAAARALAQAGADVAVASTSLDGDEVMAVRRVRRAVEQAGRRAAEYSFDLTLPTNVRVSTRQVAKEMGGLDLLVNAADLYLRRARPRPAMRIGAGCSTSTSAASSTLSAPRCTRWARAAAGSSS